MIIGLTGGVAAGKSTVARMLEEEHGAEVVDADQLAHQVMAKSTPTYRRIVEQFGEEFLRPDGEIDRPKLAELVFHEPEKLRQLESLVHPEVIKLLREQIERFRRQNRTLVVVVPLLFEKGLEGLVDKVWAVVANDEEKVRRLLARGLSKEQAWLRIRAQLPDAEKARRADLVIYNNGSLEELKEQVEWCWQNTVGEAG